MNRQKPKDNNMGYSKNDLEYLKEVSSEIQDFSKLYDEAVEVMAGLVRIKKMEMAKLLRGRLRLITRPMGN